MSKSVPSLLTLSLVITAATGLGACTDDSSDPYGGAFGSGMTAGEDEPGDTDGEDDVGSTGGDDGDGGDRGSTGGSTGGGDDSGTPPDGTTGATTDGGGSTGSPPDDPTGGTGGAGDDGVGECSAFSSADQFFTFVNTERGKYGGMFGALPHSRHKGLPWQGSGHESWTFSTQFEWDDGLAAQAQAEAEALAAGASPQGSQIGDGNGLCNGNPFWIANLNQADWKITAWETPGDLEAPNYSCPPPFALLPDNGSARQGLFYHDFGGDGPAINRLGVGAATDENCKVWWVLQFGT